MKKTKNNPLLTFLPFILVICAFVVCELMLNGVAGLSMSRSFKGMLVPICCWMIMAVSLNLVVGISGELSLGHAGFMSVGAFTGTVAATWLANVGIANEPLRLVLTFACAALMAGIAGVIIGIPVLRLSGDYLAIVTLAFGEIIRNVLNCVYVSIDGAQIHVSFLNPNLPGTGIVNGPAATKLMTAVKDEAGNVLVPAIKLSTETGFIVGFILVLLVLAFILNLVNSRSGRAIMAVRDNRIAAEATGIDVTKYRMMAFVTSAAIAGVAGALYGLNMTVDPSKFRFDQSITVLVFVVLGGIGNMTGSIISASLLTILPEKLRAFSDYRMLVYAIVLILVMLLTNNATVRSFVSATFNKLTGKHENAGKGGSLK